MWRMLLHPNVHKILNRQDVAKSKFIFSKLALFGKMIYYSIIEQVALNKSSLVLNNFQSTSKLQLFNILQLFL
jgi:hypothetical protein